MKGGMWGFSAPLLGRHRIRRMRCGGSGADCSASWNATGTHIRLNGTQAPRMFFTDLSTPKHPQLLVVDTKHESLAWTMDVSSLGGLWNGALYMVEPNFTDPNRAQWYCDANGASNGADNFLWCGEFDLIEANTCAAHTTSHGCTDPASWPYINATIKSSDVNDFCNAWGNAIAFELTSSAIDTSLPFHVNVSFGYDGDEMANFTTTFTQGSATCSKTGIPLVTTHNQNLDYAFQRDGKFALLAQLWSAKTDGGMDWLSGNNCASGFNMTEQVKLDFWNVTISNHKEHTQVVLSFDQPEHYAL